MNIIPYFNVLTNQIAQLQVIKIAFTISEFYDGMKMAYINDQNSYSILQLRYGCKVLAHK